MINKLNKTLIIIQKVPYNKMAYNIIKINET